ncbi:MAG: tRNA epoxyqueuosine(34) reductase QueG [Planctomycetota bacterium]
MQTQSNCAPAAMTHADQILLIDTLRSEAQRLGFARLGIAPAQPPNRQEVFRHWLDQGFAGVMDKWLRRQEPLRADPGTILENAQSVIMLATHYSTEPCSPALAASHKLDAAAGMPPDERGETRPSLADRGRVSRYAWGDDYHDLLRTRVNSLGAWLRASVPGCRTRGVVDSSPLAEREFGWRAGLGWFGKNTMLIDPSAGSFFFLSALLTDLVLPADQPLEIDHCGTCTACLDACPTGALPAPRVLDANRCISAITIEDHGPVPLDLRRGMGEWIFGCDICQEVCPWNRHAPVSEEPAFLPRDGERTLSLVELLALDEVGFRQRFKGSPLLRAKRRGLLRSAAIAIGNLAHSGQPLTAAVARSLETAMNDPEPVVRDAAAWALEQWREGKPQSLDTE